MGLAGEPGCVDWMPLLEWSFTARRDGESSGDEKERRYSAMKKVSFRRQKRKSTVCWM